MDVEKTFNAFSNAWKMLNGHSTVCLETLEKQKDKINGLFRLLVLAKKHDEQIVLVGAGRCADILDLFRVRLVQLGFEKSQVEVVTRQKLTLPMPRKALAICLSGSGVTIPTVKYAEEYSLLGATLVLVTSNLRGPLIDKKHAHLVIHLPGISEDDLARKEEKPESYGDEQKIYFDLIPSPTLFEWGAISLFESLVSVLNEARKIEWRVR